MSDEKGLILPGVPSGSKLSAPAASKPAPEAPKVEESEKKEEVKPKEDEDANREHLKDMLKVAHDSTEGVPISELGLDHVYWAHMNRARHYKAVKGL